uniref:Uncharacterized protein n=1 Tax=Acrobeloides nanus TaxID=290746 RepID=A0A914CDX8_9BILA
MTHLVQFFFCLILVSSILGQFNSNSGIIPEKFLGAWLYENSDNLDAYLAAKGYDEATRKTIQLPKFTRIIFKTGNKYREMIGTGLRGIEWIEGSKRVADWTFELGKEFSSKYWDGTDHKILFTYDPVGDKLTERHTVIGTNQSENFVFQLKDQNNLDLHINFKGVELIHHYKRVASH